MTIPVLVTYKGDHDEPTILVGVYELQGKLEVARLQETMRTKHGYSVEEVIVGQSISSVEDVLSHVAYDAEYGP